MRARLHRVSLAAAGVAGHVVRVGSRALPGAAGVALASAGVAWWSHQPGAGLTVAGLLLIADRVVEARRRGEL